MSLISDIRRDPRTYGTSNGFALTEVVSNGEIINPNIPTTIIDDSSPPTTVYLPGADVSKTIKLLSNTGATVQTIAGTVVLDANTTEAVLTFVGGKWVSNPVGSLIAATQKRAYIIGSDSIASGLNVVRVDQGAKNTIALATNGEILASGGPGFGTETANTGIGIIWVYERDGFDWVENYRLTSSLGTNGFFGSSVAINNDGKYIAGAATQYTQPGTGALGGVLVFEKQDDGTYAETANLARPAVGVSAFGGTMAMSGDGGLLAVGYSAFFPQSTDGSVHLFQRSGSTWSYWVTFSESTGTDDFAFVVDMSHDGDVIVASAPNKGATGAVSTYVRSHDPSGLPYIPLTQIAGEVGDGLFGLDLAIDGDGKTLAVFARSVVRTYTRTDGDWVVEQAIIPPEINLRGSVDLNSAGNVLMIGLADGRLQEETTARGIAYTYVKIGGVWEVKAGPLRAADYTVSDDYSFLLKEAFGTEVTISGSGQSAIIGAPFAYAISAGRFAIHFVDLQPSATPLALGNRITMTIQPGFIDHIIYFTDAADSPIYKPPVGPQVLYPIQIDDLVFPDVKGLVVDRIINSLAGTGSFVGTRITATTMEITPTVIGVSAISRVGVPAVSTTTTGINPPVTGAIWTFA